MRSILSIVRTAKSGREIDPRASDVALRQAPAIETGRGSVRTRMSVGREAAPETGPETQAAAVTIAETTTPVIITVAVGRTIETIGVTINVTIGGMTVEMTAGMSAETIAERTNIDKRERMAMR